MIEDIINTFITIIILIFVMVLLILVWSIEVSLLILVAIMSKPYILFGVLVLLFLVLLF